MKRRTVSFNESEYYISAWGNENIIRNYVAHFEKKLKDEVAKFKNVGINVSSAHYPNFAAWIRLYTELICNSLYWKLFRYEGEWEKINNMGFGEIRDIIMERIKQEITSFSQRITKYDINRMKESINLILNLRHSFQHGGLPNLMRDLWYGSNKEELISMLKPHNYKETKEIFLEAEKLLKLLPQPIIVVTA